MNDPDDWYRDLQLIVDVLLSGGVPERRGEPPAGGGVRGGGAGENGRGVPQVGDGGEMGEHRGKQGVGSETCHWLQRCCCRGWGELERGEGRLQVEDGLSHS